MTLEEYRLQLLERLKVCAGPIDARNLIRELDLLLQGSDLTASTREAFWATVQRDLSFLTEHLSVLRKPAQEDIAPLIEAAQQAIAEDLQPPEVPGRTPDGEP